jgi:hypothetical protein
MMPSHCLTLWCKCMSHLRIVAQIVELLAQEKGWGRWRSSRELAKAEAYLQTFHGKPGTKATPIKVAESASGVSTPNPVPAGPPADAPAEVEAAPVDKAA